MPKFATVVTDTVCLAYHITLYRSGCVAIKLQISIVLDIPHKFIRPLLQWERR